MLTIFSVPKPFEGHEGVIQRNAIRSWALLRPACQLIVCGDEPGTREIAAEVGADWIPDIARNDFGTPLVSSTFAAAEVRATHGLLCYVNADIILLPDFLAATRTIATARRRFLMVGRRCDLDVIEELDFGQDDWERGLRVRAEREGTLSPPLGTDYFVYPRGTMGPLPEFAVGRPAWDNWMIYMARRRHMAVVDATAATLVVHQNHGYDHVRQGTGDRWEGTEAERNRALLERGEFSFTLREATHRLTPRGLVGAWTMDDLGRRWRARVILAPPWVLRSMRAVRSTWREWWGAAR